MMTIIIKFNDDIHNHCTNGQIKQGLKHDDPVEAVARKVVHAATDKEPSIRYTPGKTAGRFRLMRRYVPARSVEKSFRRQMGVTN